MIKSTKDILRRAEVETIMTSVMGSLEVESSRSIFAKADALAEDVDFDPVDMVILPGGKIDIENLGKRKIVEKKCIEFAADKHVQPTA